jgi:hypothetical protein
MGYIIRDSFRNVTVSFDVNTQNLRFASISSQEAEKIAEKPGCLRFNAKAIEQDSSRLALKKQFECPALRLRKALERLESIQ